MAHPAPAPPHCPRCGATAVFHAQLNQWGCDACRQMLPAQQPPMQQPQQYYQPPPVQPMTPPCPQCRGPSTFYPAANTFGCDRCQIPVASPMAMPMMQPQGSDAGAIVLKIVLFIVLILVIVGVRVGMKAALR